MSYSQLTPDERTQLYLFHFEDCLPANAIAKLLNRHPSTILRELQRNQCEGRYLPDTAHQWMQTRAIHS